MGNLSLALFVFQNMAYQVSGSQLPWLRLVVNAKHCHEMLLNKTSDSVMLKCERLTASIT